MAYLVHLYIDDDLTEEVSMEEITKYIEGQLASGSGPYFPALPRLEAGLAAEVTLIEEE